MFGALLPCGCLSCSWLNLISNSLPSIPNGVFGIKAMQCVPLVCLVFWNAVALHACVLLVLEQGLGLAHLFYPRNSGVMSHAVTMLSGTHA